MIFQILIVDDEPHVVDTIRGILEQEPTVDIEIHTAFRGQQALKLCKQYPIQLLITDIRMPDMSGLELAKAVRENDPDCNVILLTAYSDFSYAYEGIRLQASDYILKTEEREVIRSRIFQTLERMELNLQKKSWLEIPEKTDPIADRLMRKLLLPQRASSQEEAFSLLGFGESSFPLMLTMVKVPAPEKIQPMILQKALLRYFPRKIERLCQTTPADNIACFVLALDKNGFSITNTWLMVTMERIQAVFTATTQTACSILYSYPVESLDQLAKKYHIAMESMEGQAITDSVQVISDIRNESPLVTIRFVKRYVVEHLNEDLSLSQISSVTGYNPTYLSRLFKEQTGETLIQYITRKRMDYITVLMKDKHLSMQQIMESTGFTTRSYFNQFIKKETGLPPKQYRMRLGTQLPE